MSFDNNDVPKVGIGLLRCCEAAPTHQSDHCINLRSHHPFGTPPTLYL